MRVTVGICTWNRSRYLRLALDALSRVEVTDAIRPGVVSLPHGWGHDVPGIRMRVAEEHAGVNSNVLASMVMTGAEGR